MRRRRGTANTCDSLLKRHNKEESTSFKLNDLDDQISQNAESSCNQQLDLDSGRKPPMIKHSICEILTEKSEQMQQHKGERSGRSFGFLEIFARLLLSA